MEQLYELLEKNDLIGLRNNLVGFNAVDIADFISGIPPEKVPDVFRILPKSLAVDVFSYMQPAQQEQIITLISKQEISEIMRELFVDDAVSFLEEMPSEVVKMVLAATDQTSRDKINEFLQYPPDSGGRIMTAEFVDIPAETTVGEALKIARETALDKETVYNIYVISAGRTLLGRVPLRTILACEDGVKVKDIMTTAVYAHTTDKQEEIAQKIRKYDLLSIPIVDSQKRLCGIVTVDDALDVITEEATKDVEKMAALIPSTRPYLKTNVFRMSRNRVVWLLVLMLAAALTSTVMKGFDDVIAKVIPLTFFIPMLIDAGGNAGSQASALVIRGLAVGDLRPRDIAKIIWKEVRVALICGIALAAVSFGWVLLVGGIDRAEYNAISISLVVSLTLVAIIFVAKVAGGMLPIFAQKIKLDPATMSAPVITSIVDVTGLVIYFLIAKAILGI